MLLDCQSLFSIKRLTLACSFLNKSLTEDTTSAPAINWKKPAHIHGIFRNDKQTKTSEVTFCETNYFCCWLLGKIMQFRRKKNPKTKKLICLIGLCKQPCK